MKKITLSILIAVISLPYALSQDKINKNFLSIELDPAPFILGGYSFSLRFSPKALPKTSFMASVYSSEFPNSMMTDKNREKGWTDLKIETSYAFFTDFYLNDKRRGFHFGPSVFLYNKSVKLNAVNTSTFFTTVYPNCRAGFVWYPFKKIDFYLNPWVNIGSEINIDDKNELNGVAFDSNRFNYIVALHLAYSINW